MKIRVVVLMAAALSSACAQMHNSSDYLRHSYSRISAPLNGDADYFWFDVKVTPEWPLESDVAEQQRQKWLQAWLLQRSMCPGGYEILERRPFDFLEHNPERLDLRYKVRCLVETAP